MEILPLLHNFVDLIKFFDYVLNNFDSVVRLWVPIKLWATISKVDRMGPFLFFSSFLHNFLDHISSLINLMAWLDQFLCSTYP